MTTEESAAVTPGQAVREAYVAAAQRRGDDEAAEFYTSWDNLPQDYRDDWEGIAQAAIAARQPHPAPGVTVESLTAALAGRHIGTVTDGMSGLCIPAKPRDLAVQLLTAIDARLTGDPEPQPAPGDTLRERLALLDIIAAISEHDEADVKYPAELLVSIERLAELAIADGEPHICEPLTVKPADDVKPAPELAESRKVADAANVVLDLFAKGSSGWTARISQASLARAYQAIGRPVPSELRRFP